MRHFILALLFLIFNSNLVNAQNIVYGLSHDGGSGSSLISIDPINGTTNIIYPSLGALGQDKEAPLTFDSQNGLILVETFDSTEANTSLWTIDVSTGVVNQLSKTESWGFVSNIDSNLSTTTIFNSTSSNSIYPNPSSNTINLLNPARVEKLEIIDSNGKIVIDSENQGSAINISHLNTGYYMIRLINKRGTVGIARLIKK